MKPGNNLIISLSSVNVEKTLVFYRMLGFKELSATSSVIVLTDGVKLFEVKKSEANLTRLTYLTTALEEKKEMALNLQLAVQDVDGNEFQFSDPNGVIVAVRGMQREEIFQLERKPISLCGTFAEVSIETDDIDSSIRWYENIGFKVTSCKQLYTTMDDGKIVISFYRRGTCSHKFKNPSLTYFESDMEKRIEELKQRGVQFVQDEKEIGMKGHAIAESPEGQYFFLFKA